MRLSSNLRRAALLAILTILILAGCSQAEFVAVEITFTWTAVGDDTTSGTAYVYDLRISQDSALFERAWDSCLALNDEIPRPSPAGTAESFTVLLSLESEGIYFAAVKVADEAFNWSGLSNIHRFEIPDLVPPFAIRTLVVTIGPVR